MQIIEMRIGLPSAISGLLVVIVFTATMYFSGQKTQAEVQDLKVEIKELRIEVKNGNNQLGKTANLLDLMEYRMNTVESDIRAIKGKSK